jgi:hypothetical protein
MNSVVLAQASFANPRMKLITLNNRAHDFAPDDIGSILRDHIAALGSPARASRLTLVETSAPG